MTDNNQRSNPGRGADDPFATALDVIQRGMMPVPLPANKKNPVISGWQNLTITVDNAAQYFNGSALNVGAIWGPKSNGHRDIDLDCIEAVQLAPHFLPPTRSIYGRATKRRSHYLYVGADDPSEKAVIKILDDNKASIVELRLGSGGKGSQSVMPGSRHPSGEPYDWDEDGPPGRADNAELKVAIVKIAAGAMLARHWPAQNRHDACMRVGGFLARCGWNVDAVAHFIVAVQRVAGVSDNSHVENGRAAAVDAANHHQDEGRGYGLPALAEMFGNTVAKCIAKHLGYRSVVPEPESEGGLPVIEVEGGKLSQSATEAEEALIAVNVQFFERSNILVRPIVIEVDAAHGRKTHAAQLARVDQTYMRDMLNRVADWYRLDKRGRSWVAIDPPHDIAATVLARAGEWKFHTIAGIATAPTMRPDGTILDKLGYDPATRLLLVDTQEMLPIPENPTRDDALAALALIEDLLTEFPFVDELAKSVAVSAIITPVVRGAFSVAPMHVADAPVAGSGKSYLFDLVAIIITGRLMPVITAGRSEEETEKRLGAAMLASQSLVTLDNVNGVLRGDALCQMIERPRPQVRVLGRSELIEVEARGTTLFANGNNIIVAGDICRRVIRTRLDPRMEQPELRVFTGDPVQTVLRNRGAYIAAALTICRAYIVAGRPDKKPRLASFEGWSDTVRSALTWLDKPDPVDSMERVRVDDPESGALGALLAAWVATFGTGKTQRVALRDVIAKINDVRVVDPITRNVTFVNPELRNAVHAALTAQRQPDATCLGLWLRGKKSRIVDGMSFENETSHGTSSWWVVRQDGQEIPPAM
jgi:Bifunctional DNA primase/polymerase, N-terminal